MAMGCHTASATSSGALLKCAQSRSRVVVSCVQRQGPLVAGHRQRFLARCLICFGQAIVGIGAVRIQFGRHPRSRLNHCGHGPGILHGWRTKPGGSGPPDARQPPWAAAPLRPGTRSSFSATAMTSPKDTGMDANKNIRNNTPEVHRAMRLVSKTRGTGAVNEPIGGSALPDISEK